jgi:membrane protease YdiL (CAAX protease family)
MSIQNRSLLQMSPGMRIALFIAISGISMIIGAFVTFSIVASYLHVGFDQIQRVLLSPEHARLALFSNAFASLIAFLIPSIAVAYFAEGVISKNLGFEKVANAKLFIWVTLLSIAGLLLSGALASVTELIPIPQGLKNWANGLEANYKQALTTMMQMRSIADLLINLAAVALVPAIVEELYFRGALQSNLKAWSGNYWFAIIVTSIIFSAFHFSYFGFLSRMGLGIVLGLIFQYTKSIWLCILMHFINNGVAIVALYSVKGDVVKSDKIMEEHLPLYWGVLAIVLVVYLLKQIKIEPNYE